MSATITRKTSKNGKAKDAEPTLSEQRDALIKEYGEKDAEAKVATEMGNKKEAASANATKSNLSAKISNLETDLECEGVEFEPFQKPKAPRSQRSPVSQAIIEADLAKLGRVMGVTKKEGVKKNANQRIEALLKQASKLGYKVADPRK